MLRLAALAAAVWLLLGGSAIAAPPNVVGFWYGTGQPDDKNQMWLEQFSADGGFRGVYRACIKGKAQDQILTGHWSLAGDHERIDIQTEDGTPFFRSDLYRLESFNGRIWKYRYLDLNYLYTAIRVDAKFQMPSCETVS